MAKLKLGKLPERNTVKITFTATAQLKELLDQYTALYESVYGSMEKTEDLIPFMLEGFIKSDAGFRKTRKDRAPTLRNNSPNDMPGQ